MTAAQAHFETRQAELARRSGVLADAIGHLAPASIKRVGNADWGPHTKSQWSRKALATLWAKAKATGKLNDPLKAHLPFDAPKYGSPKPLSEDHFSDGRLYGSVVNEPVRSALAKLAAANKHYDLAATMIVSGADDPGQAVAALKQLPDVPARADALRHMAEAHPELVTEEPSRAA